MKKKKIVFVPSDKIDKFAHKLIERIFGISGAWMSNESILDDFESLDSIPGHALMPLSKVSKVERRWYKREFGDLIKPERYLVWYPPVLKQEWKEIERLSRKFLLGKVENKFNISMADYPNGEPLFVWKVAEFVKRKLRES